MPSKRKSDAIEPIILESLDTNAHASASGSVEPLPKKARVTAKSKANSDSRNSSDKPQSWRDIQLEGEDTNSVPVYDDCAEIRRKIRLLQKTPGWKVTHWLEDIGGINGNSFRRFMAAKTRNDGAANGTYYAAYVFFEKVRILEGKKKTAKRTENEIEHPGGFPLENPRKHVWVIGR